MLENFDFRATIPTEAFVEEVISHLLSTYIKSEVLGLQLCELISYRTGETVEAVSERYDKLEKDYRVSYTAQMLKKYPKPE